jgi:hypothetical protein
VLPLEWRHVDWQGRCVRLDAHTTKNDEGRSFPFTADIENVLTAVLASFLRHSTRDEAPLIDASDGQFLTGATTHFLKRSTDSKWAAIPMKSQPQTRRPARDLHVRNFHCPGELLARTERYSDVRSCTQLAVNARAASTGTAPARPSFLVERQGASRLVWKPCVGPSRNADDEAIRTWIRQPHRESRDSIAPHP